MAKGCNICMDNDTKRRVKSILNDEGASADSMKALAKIPECSSGADVGCDGKGGKARSQGKRPMSAYNMFVKDCMSDPSVKALPQKRRMGQCAIRWRER